MIPVTTVDRYVIEYKKSTDQAYSRNGVKIIPGELSTTALISGLESGATYNITVIAFKGDARSEMKVNVKTPVRSVIRQPLMPLQEIQRYPDETGFYIRWAPPSVPVSYYTVTYDYTEMTESVTRKVYEPSIHVPNISQGHSADFEISYVTPDGRTGPKSVMNVSHQNGRPARPRLDPSYFEEDEVETELP